MPDREKVMAGLVTCIAACNGKTVCLYCRYMHDYSGGCETQLLSDALALLEAQEQEINRLKHHIDCEAAEKNGAGCLGYGRGINDDEPCETCKKCEKQVSYGEE